ncbi:MAG: polysaccharide pyruvyl transferase family protein [Bacilli bacterium]|nr:polysaccharide pyruvyl transferase family protein [Bacilli bacterium]MDD4808721.1 polysaccharide pyruvyl transferase family protein [Bacilli bacterium]
MIPCVPKIDWLLKKLHINTRINDIIEKAISYNCDGIIHIGGSIFMQSDDWRYKLLAYRKKMIKGKPFYIIGSNFGPYKEKEYFDYYKCLFDKADDICFREKLSYNLFSDLKNVIMSRILLFQYLQQIKQLKKDKLLFQ